MEVGITEATRKFMGLKPLPAPTEEDSFFCWDLTRADLGAPKLLAMHNTSNCLSVVSRMTGADWKKPDRMILDMIRGAIASREGFLCAADVEAYLQMAGEEIVFTKTHGRKSSGCISRLVDDLYFAELYKEDKLQWRAMRTMDRRPVHCPTRKEYVFSPEAFREDFEARLGHPCSSSLVEPARVIELQPHAAMDGVTDIAAAREWAVIPTELKRVLLSSAFCHNCGTTSFAPGYSLRMDDPGVVIVGNCSVCGAPIARCCE